MRKKKTIPTSDRLVEKPKARILLQDDEEPIREIVASMLTSDGYRCDPVESPAETLRLLRSGKIELVLCGILEWTDESMRRMLDEHPDVPVIVLTAVHDMSLPLQALRMGCYDFLLKPFEVEQLFFAVRRGLEYRRLKLENRRYARVLKKRNAKGRAW